MPSPRDDTPSADPFTATWSEVLTGTDAVDDPAVFPDADRLETVRCRAPRRREPVARRHDGERGRTLARWVVALACVVACVGVARAEVLDTASRQPGVASAGPTGPAAARGAAGDGSGPTAATGDGSGSVSAAADPAGDTSGGANGDPLTGAPGSDTTPSPTAAPGGTVPITGAPADGRADRAIAFALAQRGMPYVWGGDGPAEGGWDCSGLTKAAYGSAGVGLPRTAQAQFDAGPHVADPTTPAPGDLVFFGTPSRVHHVGLYLGNGLMAHAPHSGTVVQVGRYRWPGDDYVGASRPAAPGSAVTPGDAGSVVVPPSSSGGASDPAPEGPAVSVPDPVTPAPPVVRAPIPAVPVPDTTMPAATTTPGSTRTSPTAPRSTTRLPAPVPAAPAVTAPTAPAVTSPTAPAVTSPTATSPTVADPPLAVAAPSEARAPVAPPTSTTTTSPPVP